MSGRLVVCPTPIGNLQDITLRTLDALRDADLVACEDTRHSRGLLAHHAITTPTVAHHEHNERESAPGLVARMVAGETVALVSDAGMPGVSDPGWVLVRAAAEAGVRVEVLPGPSAVPVALVASGLPSERWTFAGFLPRKDGPLREALAHPDTLVAFESPRRLTETLGLLAALDPARPAAVCRELTKLHEEVVRGTALELHAHFTAHAPRGEIVLVVGGAPAGAADLEAALDAVAELVGAGAKARRAAHVVGGLTGVAANVLYEGLLARRK